jgi:hypothetical protein
MYQIDHGIDELLDNTSAELKYAAAIRGKSYVCKVLQIKRRIISTADTCVDEQEVMIYILAVAA